MGVSALSIKKTVSGCVSSDEITTKTLTDNMLLGQPPLDLLIRTSGVHRLSDFLLWQCTVYNRFSSNINDKQINSSVDYGNNPVMPRDRVFCCYA